jgi:2-polyprenyl-3-methyl-5-hydroxy-6-metoxy-1,4-benzoquinol methylase
MDSFSHIEVPRRFLDPLNYRLHPKGSTVRSQKKEEEKSLTRFVTVHRVGEHQIMHINLPAGLAVSLL